MGLLEAVRTVGQPLARSGIAGAVRPGAPEFGRYTDEVLVDAGGYSRQEIVELQEKEVI